MNRVVLVLAVAALTWGCTGSEPPADWVARVGDRYLTEADLVERYPALQGEADTSHARRQLIQSWVTDQILLREARDRDIPSIDSVRERIDRSTRQVLIDVLVQDLKSEVDPPTPTELRSYYERHRDELRLREPFLRVRYLSTASLDSARAVLGRWRTEGPPSDSVWTTLVGRLAEDPGRANRLSTNHLPLSVLEREIPEGSSHLDGSAGTGVAWTSGETTHLLWIADRVPEGSVPEFAWVRDRIREQVLIRRKKLNYARQVQRLRTQARANDLLEVNP